MNMLERIRLIRNIGKFDSVNECANISVRFIRVTVGDGSFHDTSTAARTSVYNTLYNPAQLYGYNGKSTSPTVTREPTI
jgi:hypothetical protein